LQTLYLITLQQLRQEKSFLVLAPGAPVIQLFFFVK